MPFEVMHLLNAIVVAENYDTGWIHNIIAKVFKVILKDAVVLPPHAIYQLKTKLLLGFDAIVHYQVGIPVISKSITLILSP